MRSVALSRKTGETEISLTLELDGSGRCQIQGGCGFLNHMLELFACHGNFDLDLSYEGDSRVDDHHTVEDIGILLGRAFDQALGDRAGISRYGSLLLPMDEALILAAVDLSGRGVLGYDLTIPAAQVGDFDTELVKEFWLAFTRELKLALHLRQLAGENSHHIVEGAFKAAARALSVAVALDSRFPERIPSTKGTVL